MSSDTTSRKVLAVILTIIIAGAGHAYVGKIKRGILLFLLAIGVTIGVSMIVPFPFSLVFIIAYYIFIIFDVLKVIRQESRQNTISTNHNYSSTDMEYCPKCGNKVLEDSSFCVKCGGQLR